MDKVQMNGINALNEMMNQKLEHKPDLSNCPLLKQKVSAPKEGIYQAILSSYFLYDGGEREDKLVLKLSCLDYETGETFEYSDFRNSIGLDIMSKNLAKFFDTDFDTVGDCIEYMMKTKFYIELTSKTVNGEEYLNCKYLRNIG